MAADSEFSDTSYSPFAAEASSSGASAGASVGSTRDGYAAMWPKTLDAQSQSDDGQCELSVPQAEAETQNDELPLHGTPSKAKRRGTQHDSASSPIRFKRGRGLPMCLQSPLRKSKRPKRNPVCARPGCGKPTWNGCSGEYCTQQVWSASFASCHHLFA